MPETGKWQQDGAERVVTYVSDYTAILSDWTWSQNEGTPAVVTYSFPAASWDEVAETYGAAAANSFVAFTATQRALAEQALDAWAAACGLVFVEVAAGEGDIRFGNFDFSLMAGAETYSGYAYYPARGTGSYNSWENEIGGDVFINLTRINDLSFGLILHELGHAIGLEHPFSGDIQLEAAYDNGT